MQPLSSSRACGLLALFLFLGAFSVRAQDAVPAFAVRTASGETMRGPQLRIGPDWKVRVGKGVGRSVAGEDVLSVRQEGLALPALPTDEQLILVNGDRFPVTGLRLKGERLHFHHPDLEGGKEASVPLTAVAVFWRMAPDRTVAPEKLRRQLAGGARTRDTVLLRNGDVLGGVLDRLDGKVVQVEFEKKAMSVKLAQVAAVALSTDLADRSRPKGLHARVVLAKTEGPSGGRFALSSAVCDGRVLRGKTTFGATLRASMARVVALDVLGGKAVHLSDLKPSKYEYRPFLDERWPWSADSSATGRDLRVGGAVYDRGVGMHTHSLLTYSLGGAYARFEAVVGLDDLDGRRGAARIRVLGDGKPLDLGSKGELTHAGGPLRLSVKVAGVKELTLESAWGDDGLVQGVVNWADARLVKKD